MITLLAVLLTWYATKVYYTRSLYPEIDDLKKNGLIQARCSKCSQSIIIKEKNMRTPFYCTVCLQLTNYKQGVGMKVTVTLAKGDAWGVGIEFYPNDKALNVSFLCWYLLIEKGY